MLTHRAGEQLVERGYEPSYVDAWKLWLASKGYTGDTYTVPIGPVKVPVPPVGP